MKKGIETYSDYDDAQVRWKLCIRKVRGKFTLDEIVEAAREWEEDIYVLVLQTCSARCRRRTRVQLVGET